MTESGSSVIGKVLVVDPEHLIAHVLSDLGCNVLRLRYHECIKGPGKSIHAEIKRGKFVGLCITYHEWRKHIPADVINQFNKEISLWLRMAH